MLLHVVRKLGRAQQAEQQRDVSKLGGGYGLLPGRVWDTDAQRLKYVQENMSAEAENDRIFFGS